MFQRLVSVAALAVLIACGGSIDSQEDAREAQIDVMEEMLDVLEGVDDEASAKDAVPDMEKLGERLAEIAEAVQKLPQPTQEEMMELQKKYAGKEAELQKKMQTEMSKLMKYPELAQAMTNAMQKRK